MFEELEPTSHSTTHSVEGRLPKRFTESLLEHDSPEKFLRYRLESTRVVNEFCQSYYGQIVKKSDGERSREIKEFFGVDEEHAKVIDFILQAFSRPNDPNKAYRKDGSHIASHSLQLFLSARDFFRISDSAVLDSVLVHDVFEDTRVTPEEMGEHLGDRYVRLAESLTEERAAAGIEKSRQAEVVAFARKVKSSGVIAIRAEIIDRIDDISDLKYLLTPPPGQESISLEQREKIVQKFAKCGYMVETISADQSDPEVIALASFFRKLVNFQIATLNSSGIHIDFHEIAKRQQDFRAAEQGE
jgi:hypothetical protein